jgi:purine-binding chemotaxis protein CheW
MQLVLIFRLADEWFGLEVDDIQEIVESPVLNFVPRAPEAIIGAINFHGNIVPVLDLGNHLGLADSTYGERAVVLPIGQKALALGVSAIHRIVPLDPELMLPCQQEEQKNLHIRMLYNYDGKMINMLDISSLHSSLETL